MIDVQGGIGAGYAEFVTPDRYSEHDDGYLIIAAFDPANPSQPITDWSPLGQPVDLILKVEGEIEESSDDEQGPGYYGSANEQNVITDFSDPHWLRVYDWNSAPQNYVTDENPEPQLFERRGYYRVTASYTDELIDYKVVGATDPRALLVGDAHVTNKWYDYGNIEHRDGYIDMKDIQYPEIVFMSYNTPGEYEKDTWSREGKPVPINVIDMTDKVVKLPNGNYIKGPAYYAGYNVGEAESQFTYPGFIGPLNTQPGIEKGKRYLVVAQSDLKGKAAITFAPNREALYPFDNQNEEQFDVTDIVLQADDRRYFRAS